MLVFWDCLVLPSYIFFSFFLSPYRQTSKSSRTSNSSVCSNKTASWTKTLHIHTTQSLVHHLWSPVLYTRYGTIVSFYTESEKSCKIRVFDHARLSLYPPCSFFQKRTIRTCTSPLALPASIHFFLLLFFLCHQQWCGYHHNHQPTPHATWSSLTHATNTPAPDACTNIINSQRGRQRWLRLRLRRLISLYPSHPYALTMS